MLNLLVNNKETLITSLNVLWKGLLAIFVVVTIVIAVTYLLKYIVEKFTKSKEKTSDDNEAADADN